MSQENAQASKVQVIKANYSLQNRVGSGPIDKGVVERCQQVLDNNTVDFAPLANGFLDSLKNAIIAIKKSKTTDAKAINSLTEPVMQLKANAAMFKYHLIGNLANVMLSFLESVKLLDDDAIAIIEAHQQTLSAIVLQKIQGNGGANGKQLEDELKGACQRYLKKIKKPA